MAREGTADPVNDALQRVSQDEPRREAATNEEAIDWVIVALVVLVLALIGLGILTLFEGWFSPADGQGPAQAVLAQLRHRPAADKRMRHDGCRWPGAPSRGTACRRHRFAADAPPASDRARRRIAPSASSR